MRYSINTRRSYFVAALAFGVLASGCGVFGGGGGAKQTMTTSAESPAGEGTVQATKGESDNTKLEVRVKHLPAPSKLADDASVYVVWIQPPKGDVQNVGALAVDKDLVGKLETTTPHKSFKLTVTPEPSARMAAPTHKPVFTSMVNRVD
ncbi:MAG TPA: hypothetical protein VM925_27455 [Labilithrix sp.]|nr:hypothetical protein [Labilithrix sp.]